MCLEYWHVLGIKKCVSTIFSSTNLIKEWSFFIRCSILFNFCINMVTFPWEIVHILSVLSFLSKLETPISLVVQYLNYPRIVAGGISNKLVFTALAALVPNSTPMLILQGIKATIYFSILCFFCFPLLCFLQLFVLNVKQIKINVYSLKV